LNSPGRIHFYDCSASAQILRWAAELGLAGENGAPIQGRLENIESGALRIVSIAVLRPGLYASTCVERQDCCISVAVWTRIRRWAAQSAQNEITVARLADALGH
jgi:hypothetical protein